MGQREVDVSCQSGVKSTNPYVPIPVSMVHCKGYQKGSLLNTDLDFILDVDPLSGVRHSPKHSRKMVRFLKPESNGTVSSSKAENEATNRRKTELVKEWEGESICNLLWGYVPNQGDDYDYGPAGAGSI